MKVNTIIQEHDISGTYMWYLFIWIITFSTFVDYIIFFINICWDTSSGPPSLELASLLQGKLKKQID